MWCDCMSSFLKDTHWYNYNIYQYGSVLTGNAIWNNIDKYSGFLQVLLRKTVWNICSDSNFKITTATLQKKLFFLTILSCFPLQSQIIYWRCKMTKDEKRSVLFSKKLIKMNWVYEVSLVRHVNLIQRKTWLFFWPHWQIFDLVLSINLLHFVLFHKTKYLHFVLFHKTKYLHFASEVNVGYIYVRMFRYFIGKQDKNTEIFFFSSFLKSLICKALL